MQKSLQKFKLFNLSLSVILFLFDFGFSQSNELDNSNKIKNALNHASTYYWLARYKDSDSNDFLKARNWYESALKAIESDSLNEYKDLYIIAKKGLEDTDIRYDNNFDNIHNDYPIFDLITKRVNTYEYYDDPDVAAATYSIDGALDILDKTQPKDDIQVMMIVISDPVNNALEDELLYSINSYAQFFPRPAEEILQNISIEEFETLYQIPDLGKSSSILDKLLTTWNQRHLMIVKLVQNDIVDDVYYFGTWIYLYDSEKKKIIKSIYSDGFSEDRRRISSDIVLLISMLLTLSLILNFIISPFYSLLTSKSKREVKFYSVLFSLFCSMVIHIGIIATFNLWAPESSSLSILPMNRLWIFSFALSLSIIPIFLTYLVGIKIPGISEKLSDGETLASFGVGSILATLGTLGYFFIIKFNFMSFLPFAVVACSLSLVTSIFMGYGISKKFFEDENKGLIYLPLYLLTFIFIIISVMAADIFYSYLAIISGALAPIAIFQLLRIIRSRESIDSMQINSKLKNDLSPDNYVTILQNPTQFIEKIPGLNFRDEVADFFFDEKNNKIKILLIDGPRGCGKTRMAREIAKSVINKYNDKKNLPENKDYILFGDCDELSEDGSGVPFEPFSQAMHSMLGAGRFEPASKRANKIKAGFEELGMNDALGTVGLGIMNNILGSSNEKEEITQSTVVEMADIIEKTLVQLSKDRPVVFIIDDTHWIDGQTFALFKVVLQNLVSMEKLSDVHFIATNCNTFTDESNIIFKKTLKSFGPNKLINLKVLDSSTFLDDTRFEEFLSRGLYFDNQSASRLSKYLIKFKVNNISQVIQTVKTLLSRDLLNFNKHTVSLHQDFNERSIDPPGKLYSRISKMLTGLTVNQRRIIECAAFIGNEVNASTISTALKLPFIDTLDNLRDLEKKGFINDVLDQDDVYQFASSNILNGIRFSTSKSSEGTTNISQLVKEYQFLITRSISEKHNIDYKNDSTFENIDDNIVFKLAKRSMASGDRMLEQALSYNIEAQIRAKKKNYFYESIVFGKNVLDIIERLNTEDLSLAIFDSFKITIVTLVETNQAPKKITDTYLKMKKIVTNSKEIDYTVLLHLSCLYVDAIIHDFSGWYSEEIKKTLHDDINDILTAEKFDIHELISIYGEISINRLSKDKGFIEKLNMLLNKLDKIKPTSLKENYFKDRLISELIEDKIKELIEYEKVDDDSMNLIKSGIKIKEKIDDTEGLCQLKLFLADYLAQNNEYEKAEKIYKEALGLAKDVGSMDFASDAHSGLGKIFFKNNDLKNALIQFSKACVESKFDENIPNQYNALIGIHKIGLKTKNKEILIEYSDEVSHLNDIDMKKDEQFEELSNLIKDCNDFYDTPSFINK